MNGCTSIALSEALARHVEACGMSVRFIPKVPLNNDHLTIEGSEGLVHIVVDYIELELLIKLVPGTKGVCVLHVQVQHHP